jgi:hypothetical protein
MGNAIVLCDGHGASGKAPLLAELPGNTHLMVVEIGMAKGKLMLAEMIAVKGE